MALIIASAGLYGVMSSMVSHRLREIALRMALAGALAAGRQLEPMLFGVSAGDGRTLAGAVAVVAIIAAVAIVVPLRRAVRVDPAGLLRTS